MNGPAAPDISGPRPDAALIGRLLDVISDDILPRSRAGVAAGNKIFGAAILRKADLSVIVAETNNETANPLWHGEMHALKRLYEQEREAVPDPRDCIFLSTHEPCSLCLSAITWGGYDNFYYLFSHQDSRDSFGIPHDIRILREVFATGPHDEAAPLYNRSNAFWQSHAIRDMIAALDPSAHETLSGRVSDLTRLYSELSALYQARKGHDDGIPLA